MKKLLLSLTALLMTLTLLAGCTPKKPDPVSYEVRLGVLKGPTGIGASYLLEKNEKGETLNKYDVKVEAEATAMVSMLASGELDMAALPTNVASSLYNKTDGGVKLIALNTAGVLYILENGNTVSSIADLKGKTIYAVGQGSNPEYVLRYILENNGLKE
ncbi:MAG: ABC transporter substrate-binding protein, partial [Erysipelotrichaceae bacterium]|nr:ABC transporter substrate-binding protein [Erysipelotrichaceae bacterium]